jgi:hypothetical protein
MLVAIMVQIYDKKTIYKHKYQEKVFNCLCEMSNKHGFDYFCFGCFGGGD